MSSAHPLDLTALGWDDSRERELRERFGTAVLAARVIRSAKGLYLVRSPDREANARLTGAFEFRVSGPAELPAVGDWVAVASTDDASAPYRIDGVLRRTSAIARKQAGEKSIEQILAANVDVGCIVFSLEGGRKCNPRAAERYTTMIWGSGAQPLILLNKTDLAADAEGSAAEIAGVAPGVEVLPLSCATGVGIDLLRRHLKAGTTSVLLGPSGVGKSTLINVLSGSERQAVGAVREGDLRGRHTTTHRELILLPGGAMIIDTPGLRELQLWAEDAELDYSFADIAELATACRFRDCSHAGEPGCAVQAALASGALPQERLAAYLELRREIAYLERRSDDRLRREERDRWKRIHREARNFSKERRSGGK